VIARDRVIAVIGKTLTADQRGFTLIKGVISRGFAVLFLAGQALGLMDFPQ
jgi:hypothetical protein